MTNPDNIVRVRARNGGRASVYEANGWAQAYTSGLLEGNGVVQNTVADMHVLVGGSTTKPDVVLAENASGYKVALDLIGQQPLTITTPASNSRISAIVAYTDDLALATTEDSVTGSPASCGLIVVNGTASATPSAPNDTAIRSAITADGATGSQAAYCVIATILVANDTTTITDSLITNNPAQIGASNIDFATFNFTTDSLSSNFTIDTTEKTVLSVTVPDDGIWMVVLSGFAQSATTAGYYRPYLYINSTRVTEPALEASIDNRKNISQTTVQTLNKNDVVSLKMYADAGTYICRKASCLSLLRVG